MSLNRDTFGEALGWIVGVLGLGFVGYAIFIGTSGESSFQTFIVAGGWIVGGAITSLIGLVVAMTYREHRGKGHMSNQAEPSRADDES